MRSCGRWAPSNATAGNNVVTAAANWIVKNQFSEAAEFNPRH